MAKSPYLKQRKKTDDEFSINVRLKAADEHGYVKCVTCGKIGYWEKDGMDCGHFMRRALMATRFDPMNCRVQCKHCNDWLKGNILEFEDYLIEEIGIEAVRNLRLKAKMGGGLDTYGMKLLEQELKAENKQLRLEKGL